MVRAGRQNKPTNTTEQKTVQQQQPAEPVVTEPVAEPVAEPAVTEPVAEPAVTEPVAEPAVTEPVAEPAVAEPEQQSAAVPPQPNYAQQFTQYLAGNNNNHVEFILFERQESSTLKTMKRILFNYIIPIIFTVGMIELMALQNAGSFKKYLVLILSVLFAFAILLNYYHEGYFVRRYPHLQKFIVYYMFFYVVMVACCLYSRRGLECCSVFLRIG